MSIAGSEFAFSFDPNGAVNLEGLGTVYESTRVVDGWGILDVESGGALFLRNPEGLFTGVVVAVPSGSEGAPSSGEGWTLELADGWQLAAGERAGDWVVQPDAGGQ